MARLVLLKMTGRRALTGADQPNVFAAALSQLSAAVPSRPFFHYLSTAFEVLFATVASTLAAVLELFAQRTADPSFWAFTRLLPLPLSLFAASLSSDVAPSVAQLALSTVFWLALVAGQGVTAYSSETNWLFALAWAASSVGCVVALQAAQARGREAETGNFKPTKLSQWYARRF